MERAYLLMYMAELDAMRGSFGDARERLAQAERLHLEFAQAYALVTVWPRAAAMIELLAGAPSAAAAILETAAAQLDAEANAGWFSTLAAYGAAALVEAGVRRGDRPGGVGARLRAGGRAGGADHVAPYARPGARGEGHDTERSATRSRPSTSLERQKLPAIRQRRCSHREAGARGRPPDATAAMIGEALQRLTDKGNIARVGQIRARAVSSSADNPGA